MFRHKKIKTDMARKKFKIRARISFSGRFEVDAHSRQEAEEIVEKSVGAILGQVEVQDEHVSDWDVQTHGTTVVNRREEGEV